MHLVRKRLTDNYKSRLLKSVGRMLASPQYPFAVWAIKGAPDDPGLFALYRRGELLCIGIAQGVSADDTIRARLLGLLENAANLGAITHYQWEISFKPQQQRELYLKQLGRAAGDCAHFFPRP